MTINVNATNDAPTAVDDAFTIAEDGTLDLDIAGGVLANDTDPDGDALIASLVSGPANGTLTLNADGSLSYTPNANFNGTDTFTYSASDGGLSDEATVTITVTPENDPPWLSPMDTQQTRTRLSPSALLGCCPTTPTSMVIR